MFASRSFASFSTSVLLLLALATPVRAQDDAGEPLEPMSVEASEPTEPAAPPVTPPERAPIAAEAPPAITVAAPAPRLVRPHTFEAEAIIDTFWGFHVHGRGAIALHELIDLTVHATLYTNPRLSGGASRTVDVLWAETGLGARAVLLDGALWAGLEVGLMHGSLLSDSTVGIPLDGIAVRPYADLRLPLIDHVLGLDALLQFTFWGPLRQSSEETRTIFHTIARVGPTLFDIVALGPYWEHLYSEAGAGKVHYAWLGGYAEARFDFGLVVGAAAGVDFTPEDALTDGEFYRAWLGWRL
jgi:hypothetical protein